jgi:hypothetical protein
MSRTLSAARQDNRRCRALLEPLNKRRTQLTASCNGMFCDDTNDKIWPLAPQRVRASWKQPSAHC